MTLKLFKVRDRVVVEPNIKRCLKFPELNLDGGEVSFIFMRLDRQICATTNEVTFYQINTMNVLSADVSFVWGGSD